MVDYWNEHSWAPFLFDRLRATFVVTLGHTIRVDCGKTNTSSYICRLCPLSSWAYSSGQDFIYNGPVWIVMSGSGERIYKYKQLGRQSVWSFSEKKTFNIDRNVLLTTLLSQQMEAYPWVCVWRNQCFSSKLNHCDCFALWSMMVMNKSAA